MDAKREEVRALDSSAHELENRVEALREKLGSFADRRASLAARWTAAKDSEASKSSEQCFDVSVDLARGVMEQDHRLGVLQV